MSSFYQQFGWYNHAGLTGKSYTKSFCKFCEAVKLPPCLYIALRASTASPAAPDFEATEVLHASVVSCTS
jgi:hypothetical protein